MIVSEDTLTQAATKLRKAFRDDARNCRYIQSVLKRGYGLCAAVAFAADSPQARTRVSDVRGERFEPASIFAASFEHAVDGVNHGNARYRKRVARCAGRSSAPWCWGARVRRPECPNGRGSLEGFTASCDISVSVSPIRRPVGLLKVAPQRPVGAPSHRFRHRCTQSKMPVVARPWSG